MSTLEERFNKATEDAMQIGVRPETAVLLQSYALFKQATIGDVRGERPTDTVGMAKYDAWEQIIGMSTKEAMQRYIVLIEAQKG